MKDLSFLQGVSLPISAGSATPEAVPGTEIWSTVENALLFFDGALWQPSSGAGGNGDVIGPNASVAGNQVDFDSATGKLIADSGSGRFAPEIFWTATSNVSSTLVNSAESLGTFTLAPGEKAVVKLCYAYRLSVTTMGATLGLWVPNTAGNNVTGSYQLMQCVNTAPATNVLSVGGSVANSTSLMFYQNASSVASSANANLGFLMEAVVKNEHATDPLTVSLLIGTLGTGVTTVMAGSMAMLIRL